MSTSDTSATIKMPKDWSQLKDENFYLDNKRHYYTIVNDGTIGDSAEIMIPQRFTLMA